MDLLGTSEVGYGKLDFPALNLSVVGSRPFSWGETCGKMPGFIRSALELPTSRNPQTGLSLQPVALPLIP